MGKKLIVNKGGRITVASIEDAHIRESRDYARPLVSIDPQVLEDLRETNKKLKDLKKIIVNLKQDKAKLKMDLVAARTSEQKLRALLAKAKDKKSTKKSDKRKPVKNSD